MRITSYAGSDIAVSDCRWAEKCHWTIQFRQDAVNELWVSPSFIWPSRFRFSISLLSRPDSYTPPEGPSSRTSFPLVSSFSLISFVMNSWGIAILPLTSAPLDTPTTPSRPSSRKFGCQLKDRCGSANPCANNLYIIVPAFQHCRAETSENGLECPAR